MKEGPAPEVKPIIANLGRTKPIIRPNPLIITWRHEILLLSFFFFFFLFIMRFPFFFPLYILSCYIRAEEHVNKEQLLRFYIYLLPSRPLLIYILSISDKNEKKKTTEQERVRRAKRYLNSFSVSEFFGFFYKNLSCLLLRAYFSISMTWNSI